jgi:5'-nucleotidase
VKRSYLVISLLVGLVCAGSVQAQTLRVLVTNDDGIGAPGIDALVEALALNPNLQIDVVAPATNQSGTADSFTTAPFTVSSSMTASGHAGTAVDGTPVDAVMYALLVALPQPPDLVVSGINLGQNITRYVAEDLSGTVGAALTAARRGIPAFAVSQGVPGTVDYATAAEYTANLVELFRTKKGLGKKMTSKTGQDTRLVLNVNVPTCAAGSVRGARLVPLKQSQNLFGRNVVDYDMTAPDTYQAVLSTDNAFLAQDCTSALDDPADDLEALQNGFISITPLNPTLTPDTKLKKFKIVVKKVPVP